MTCPQTISNILIMCYNPYTSHIKRIQIDNINSSVDDIRNLVQYVKTHYRKGIDYEAYSSEVRRDGHLMPSEYVLDNMRIKSTKMLNDRDFTALLKRVEQFPYEYNNDKDNNEPFFNFNIGFILFVSGFLIFIALVMVIFSSR